MPGATAKTKTKTAAEVFAECGSCFRERRLTAEGVLVEHRAWIWLEMRPCGDQVPPRLNLVWRRPDDQPRCGQPNKGDMTRDWPRLGGEPGPVRDQATTPRAPSEGRSSIPAKGTGPREPKELNLYERELI